MNDVPATLAPMAPSPLPAPLASRYEVVEVLAADEARCVARVRSLPEGHPKVLKTLDTHRVDAAEAARFRQEAAALSRLQHPRVLRISEQGEEDGVVFFLAPDAGAESLRSRMAEGQPLPFGTAARLLDHMLEALEAVHEAGFLHRDVTPANILILPDGNFQLLDFGITRRVEVSSALTETGELLGTPAWMAPEQVMGKPPDLRDDLYSLGLVAYTALSGANPMDTPDLEEVLHRQLHAPLPPLATPGAPRALLDLVTDLTARRRADRPASARAARARLRPGAPAPGTGSTRRRGPALLLLLLALLGGALVLSRGEGPRGAAAAPDPTARLARALTALDRDPTIAAALVVQGVRATPDTRRAWDAGRARLRGLLDPLRAPLVAAAEAPPSPALASAVHQLWLRAELLHRTALPDAPERGALLAPLARAASRTTTRHPGPWLPTPRTEAPDQADAYLRELTRDGSRWRVLRRAADYHMVSGGRLRYEDGIKILDLQGEPFVDPMSSELPTFSGMLKESVAYDRDDVPTEVSVDLQPRTDPGQDLWLAFVMPLWRRTAAPDLRLVGREETVRLSFPVPGEAAHGRGTFTGTVLVRVAAGAIPRGARRAVLVARSIQPFASPHQICRVAEVLQLAEGAVPATSLAAFRRAGAEAWSF